MALEQRIASLQKLHDDTENEIRALIAHPSSDGLDLQLLKRKKLGYKDSITRLMTLSEQRQMGQAA